MNYEQLLASLISQVVAQGASDLHLTVGVRPIIRVSGTLTPFFSETKLTNEDIKALLTQMIPPDRMQKFLTTQEIDFSFSYGTEGRFRGNAFFERGNIGVALRLIPKAIKTLKELNLPQSLEQFALQKHGF